MLSPQSNAQKKNLGGAHHQTPFLNLHKPRGLPYQPRPDIQTNTTPTYLTYLPIYSPYSPSSPPKLTP